MATRVENSSFPTAKLDDMTEGDDAMMYYGPPMSMEIDVIYAIETYLFPIILLLGIVGNLLAIPVLYVISVRNWSTVFYLSLLSVVDLLILLVRCGDTWYAQITASSLSERIMNSSDALCKTYMFAFNFVLHLSPWLMVAVAVEMTIAVRWPQRIYFMCTLERANNVVMLLVILIVCLDINYFWTWGVPSPAFGCRYTEEFSTEFRDTIWPAMTNVIQYLSPLILVSICFFLTAATMITRRSRDDKCIERELKKYFLELSTLKDFRVVCLIFSLIFMCLTLFTITTTLVEFLEVKGYLELDDEAFMKYSLLMMLLKTLEMTFYALFYSLKISVYFGCSSTFRDTMKQGFLWVRQRTRRALGPKPQLTTTRNQERKDEDGESWNGASNYQSKPLIENTSASAQTRETVLAENVTGVATETDRNPIESQKSYEIDSSYTFQGLEFDGYDTDV